MTTIALDYIHAARHALDEGAIQTARCLLDSAEKHLVTTGDSTGAASLKPKQSVKAASPVVQPSLLTQAKSIDEWVSIIRKWIERLPNGQSFTHHQLCKWVENESGVILNDADHRYSPGDKERPMWKLRISRALERLKGDGTLSGKARAGNTSRSCDYVVARCQ